MIEGRGGERVSLSLSCELLDLLLELVDDQAGEAGRGNGTCEEQGVSSTLKLYVSRNP